MPEGHGCEALQGSAQCPLSDPSAPAHVASWSAVPGASLAHSSADVQGSAQYPGKVRSPATCRQARRVCARGGASHSSEAWHGTKPRWSPS